MKQTNCVQCGKEMNHSYGNDHWAAPYCEDPACPNFNLLQVGIIGAEKIEGCGCLTCLNKK